MIESSAFVGCQEIRILRRERPRPMLNLSVGQPGGNGPLHQEFHLDEVLADLGGADCGDKTEIRSRRFVLQRVFGRGSEP